MSVLGALKGWFLGKRVQSGAALVGLPEAYYQKQRFQFDFLTSVGLLPDHTFADIGCGVLRGGMPIIKHLNPECYAGLDVNAEAISIGVKEVRKLGLEYKKPILIHISGPLSDCVLPFSIDRAWAFSVLIHMTDDHVRDCLRFVRDNLKPEGIFYANVNVGQSQDGAWRRFPVKWRELSWFDRESRDFGLQVSDLGTLASFGHRSLTDVREDEQHMLEFRHLG